MEETETKWALEKIKGMSHEEMARMWRFEPSGHEWFTNPVLSQAFQVRFATLGGMTPEISKLIGWGDRI